MGRILTLEYQGQIIGSLAIVGYPGTDVDTRESIFADNLYFFSKVNNLSVIEAASCKSIRPNSVCINDNGAPIVPLETFSAIKLLCIGIVIV